MGKHYGTFTTEQDWNVEFVPLCKTSPLTIYLILIQCCGIPVLKPPERKNRLFKVECMFDEGLMRHAGVIRKQTNI